MSFFAVKCIFTLLKRRNINVNIVLYYVMLYLCFVLIMFIFDIMNRDSKIAIT